MSSVLKGCEARLVQRSTCFTARESQDKNYPLQVLSLLVLLALAPFLQAEHLPIRSYTTADGLPGGGVFRIVQDSHGFLWFCTSNGLSRFDGYTFTNYGIEQGLAGAAVDLFETPQEEYWVATSTGLYRFDPRASRPVWDNPPSAQKRQLVSPPMFEWHALTDLKGNRIRVVFKDRQGKTTPRYASVHRVIEDRRGRVWIATNAGLYRLDKLHGRWIEQDLDPKIRGESKSTIHVAGLLEDRAGTVWVSTGLGLFRIWQEGRVERCTLVLSAGKPTPGLDEMVTTIFEDHEGSVWLGGPGGLLRVVSQPGDSRLVVAQVSDAHVRAIFESSGRRLWVATITGLSEFVPAFSPSERGALRIYSGLPGARTGIWTLAEDQAGNLWMGTQTGAIRMALCSFITYDEAEGLTTGYIHAISEDQTGKLYVVSSMPPLPGPHPANTNGYISGFDGVRFTTFMPRLPSGTRIESSKPMVVLQDHNGEWWITTPFGLCRYKRVARLDELAHRSPKSVNTKRNGLPSESIQSLYEDSHGDIWIGSHPGPTIFRGTLGSISRWRRSSGTFQVFGAAEGLTIAEVPATFAEDRAHNLWIGFVGGGLARYDAENRLIAVHDDLNSVAEYTYDAFGRRVSKTVPGSTVEYLYDQAGRVVAERDVATGNWNRSEIYAGGRHLATYARNTTYFRHSDWLGSSRVKTLPDGSVAPELCTNLPFGDGLKCVPNPAGQSPSPNLFADYERDPETQLDHTMFRKYSSAQGRWTTPDPYLGSMDLANPQSFNRYAYVLNTPTNLRDPLGLDAAGVSYEGCLVTDKDGKKHFDPTISAEDCKGPGRQPTYSGSSVDVLANADKVMQFLRLQLLLNVADKGITVAEALGKALGVGRTPSPEQLKQTRREYHCRQATVALKDAVALVDTKTIPQLQKEYLKDVGAGFVTGCGVGAWLDGVGCVPGAAGGALGAALVFDFTHFGELAGAGVEGLLDSSRVASAAIDYIGECSPPPLLY